MNKKKQLKINKINQNIEAYLSRFAVTQKRRTQKKIKLNLKNKLRKNLFFSRLFNKNIDLAKLKSANKLYPAKSLKLRILKIRKVNKKLNKQCLARYRLNLLNVSMTQDYNKTNLLKKKVVKNKVLKKSTSVGTEQRVTAPTKYQLFALDFRPKRFLNNIQNPNYQYNIKLSKYLKTITSFDPEIAQFQNIVYNFNNNKKKFKINSILENTFNSLNSLIGTPVFEITPNNMTINLFYYFAKKAYLINILKILLKKHSKKKMLQNKYLTHKILRNQSGLRMKFRFYQKTGKLMYLIEQKFKYLKSLILFLSKKLKKPIKLDLIRLKNPTLDSKISANAFGLIVNNLNTKFLYTTANFFEIANIQNPTFIKNIIASKKNSDEIAILSGINLKKAGRLVTQPIIPKLTTKIIQHGSINRTNTDFVTSSRFTAKNKRGAFSITITMGHKFF